MLPQPWRALTPRRDLNPAASETACQELNTAKAFKVTGKKGGDLQQQLAAIVAAHNPAQLWNKSHA
jgi:hypothetical protein